MSQHNDPESYIQLVTNFAKVDGRFSLYHGENYRSLAKFIAGPDRPNFNTAYSFLWVYRFNDSERKRDILSSAADATQLEHDSGKGQILFLRGLPSPKWIAQLGGRLQVDPNMWKTHLSYLQPEYARSLRHSASFAARSSISIPIVSIGKRGEIFAGTNRVVERERATAAKRMSSYLDTLRSENIFDSGWRTGDSVVREFRLLDEEWFTISQTCTIHLKYDSTKSGSWTLFINSDAGEDLAHSHAGPWKDLSARYKREPRFQSIELSPPPITSLHDLYTEEQEEARGPALPEYHQFRLPQSLGKLHMHYGRFLVPRIMQQDPFYALNEVLQFFAASESFFITKISETTPAIQISLHNTEAVDEEVHQRLVHSQELLDEHVIALSDVINFVRKRGDEDWPKAQDQEGRLLAERAAHHVQETLEGLMERAERLRQGIERTLTTAMNIASIGDARRGIDQAKSAFRLTVFAALYAPLAFATSFFGMNFVEFGTGSLRIWVFFATLVPFIVISSGLLFIDFKKLLSCFKRQ